MNKELNEECRELFELPEEEAKKKFFELEMGRRIMLCEILNELRTKLIFDLGPNVEYIMALGDVIEILQDEVEAWQESEE